MNDKGDFTGKLIEKEGQFYVNQPQHETLTTTKNDTQSIIVLRCFHNKKSDDIVKECQEHANGVTFF
jgi:hypothetical protein